MTGPEHYAEAQQLLRSRTEYFNGGQTKRDFPPSAEQIARAQVHATLAMVAATIECASDLSPRTHFAGNGNYITQGTQAEAWQAVLR